MIPILSSAATSEYISYIPRTVNLKIYPVAFTHNLTHISYPMSHSLTRTAKRKSEPGKTPEMETAAAATLGC